MAIIKAYSNPLFPTPSKLGNKCKGFHYVGASPRKENSYGAYVCKHDTIGIVSSKGQDLFCPVCGSTMKEIGRLNSSKTKELNKTEMFSFPKCSSCGKSHISSANWITEGSEKTYCVNCGDNITDNMEKMKYSNASVSLGSRKIIQEALVKPEEFENVKEDQIEMYLYETDNNAFWNIEIDATPVAQIRLSDQENPDEVKSLFLDSTRYSAGIIGSIAKSGLTDTLKAVNARIWATKVDVADVYKQARKEAYANIEKENNGYGDNLLSNIALVCAGKDKNLFGGNPLKSALFDELSNYGVAENDLVNAIEAGFTNGASDYFEEVLDKATAFMNYSEKALKEVKAIVGSNDYIKPTPNRSTELGAELESKNFPLKTMKIKADSEDESLKNLFSRFSKNK
jgi:uncharacterized Zn finger protein